MWCAVRARTNTTHISKESLSNGPVPGAEVVPYNAAASVNMAVWFFFWLWLANTSVVATNMIEFGIGLTAFTVFGRTGRSTFCPLL